LLVDKRRSVSKLGVLKGKGGEKQRREAEEWASIQLSQFRNHDASSEIKNGSDKKGTKVYCTTALLTRAN
jgi:hypothetical protein